MINADELAEKHVGRFSCLQSGGKFHSIALVRGVCGSTRAK